MKFRESELAETRVDELWIFASFESRCLAVFHEMHAMGFSGPVVAYVCEDLMRPETKAHLVALRKIVGNRLKVIRVSYRDPLPMILSCPRNRLSGSVLIDITCFNRENLFPFLQAQMIGIGGQAQVSFAYTPPKRYGSWLSRGYDAAHNIIGFAGPRSFSSRRLTVCLVGYESVRALKIIEASEPSRVILGLGSIPSRGEFVRRNIQAVNAVTGFRECDVVELNVRDPQQCLEDLERILQKVDEFTALNIAPLNTKLSCLSVYAYWAQRRSIRIWNALPQAYNSRQYSMGAGRPRYYKVEHS